MLSTFFLKLDEYASLLPLYWSVQQPRTRITGLNTVPVSDYSFYTKHYENKMRKFQTRFMPGMKEWDIFAPSPNLGVAQRCLAAYTEHIADRPAAIS